MSWGYDRSLERAPDEVMESKTARATAYDLQLDPLTSGPRVNWLLQRLRSSQHLCTLRVLDTPGFGDTRGMHEDTAHHKSIVSAMEQTSSIHAIFLVVNGRESRMSPHLHYVLA